MNYVFGLDVCQLNIKEHEPIFKNADRVGFKIIESCCMGKVIKFINLLLVKKPAIKFEFFIEYNGHCSTLQYIIEKTSMLDIFITCIGIFAHKDVKFGFPLPRKLSIKTKDTYYFTDLICEKNKIHDYLFLELICNDDDPWIKDVSVIDELKIYGWINNLEQPELFTRLQTLHIFCDAHLVSSMKHQIYMSITNFPHVRVLHTNQELVIWMNTQKPKKSLYMDEVFIHIKLRRWNISELPSYRFNELFKSENNKTIPRVTVVDTTTDESKVVNTIEIQLFNSRRHLVRLPKSFLYSILHLYMKKTESVDSSVRLLTMFSNS